MHFISIIEKVTKDFIETFNKRDFDKLALFLATNFHIESENIPKIYPDATDIKIYGVNNAIEYWQRLVSYYPDFYFDNSVNSISHEGKNIFYIGKLQNGKPLHAKFTMNEYAKIEHMLVEYPESI
ncbi:MAG: hypothetical protein IT257_08830 [Chitinophagaceae bacterium]|nr:hypothetical protein [Chitinophagaceae bacterium]